MPIVKIDKNGITINGEMFNVNGDGVDLKIENVQGDGRYFEMVSNRYYAVDVTHGGGIFLLPEEPKSGDRIVICDLSKNMDNIGFETNSIIVDGNSRYINGWEKQTLDLGNTAFEFRYIDETDEWYFTVIGSWDIQKTLGKFACVKPIIGNISSRYVDERDYIELDIFNYDKDAVYIPLSTNNIVYSVRHSHNNTFQIHFGAVEDDIDIEFSIIATKKGLIYSPESDSVSMTVENKPEVSDDSIVNSLLLDNMESSTNCDVSNDIAVFTENDGEYVENTTTQGDDENEWTSYQTIARTKLAKFDIFKSNNEDFFGYVGDGENDKILNANFVYAKSDDDTTFSKQEVDAKVFNDDATGNILDIFEDGSCLDMWQFKGNAISYNGNEATVVGNCNFDNVVKYKKGISYYDNDEAQYVKVDEISDTKSAFTYSCFFTSKHGDGENDTYTYLCRDKADDSVYGIIVNYDNDSASNTIGVRFNGDYQKVTIPNDDKLIYSDVYFIAFYWDKTIDDGIPHIFIKNFTQDYEYTLDYDDLALTDDMSVGFDMIVGTDDTTSSRILTSVEHLRIFNKSVSDDELDELKNEEYPYYDCILEDGIDGDITSVFIGEEFFRIETALSSETITDDDFNDENMVHWDIDEVLSEKVTTYEKVLDYKGSNFQRKVIGDKNANITYLKSDMWKEE